MKNIIIIKKDEKIIPSKMKILSPISPTVSYDVYSYVYNRFKRLLSLIKSLFKYKRMPIKVTILFTCMNNFIIP